MTNGWTKCGVCPCNEILVSKKNKWCADRCLNIHEPWKHYAKWKKLVTKEPILFDFIYMKHPVDRDNVEQGLPKG